MGEVGAAVESDLVEATGAVEAPGMGVGGVCSLRHRFQVRIVLGELGPASDIRSGERREGLVGQRVGVI